MVIPGLLLLLLMMVGQEKTRENKRERNRGKSAFFWTKDPNQLAATDMANMTEFIFSTCWSPKFSLRLFSDSQEATLAVFRGLHYPYPLSRSMVGSVNPHNAGQIIGALVWLVELAELDEEQGLGPTIMRGVGGAGGGSGGEAGEEGLDLDQLWLNYLASAFRAGGKRSVVETLDEQFCTQLTKHGDTVRGLTEEEVHF